MLWRTLFKIHNDYIFLQVHPNLDNVTLVSSHTLILSHKSLKPISIV